MNEPTYLGDGVYAEWEGSMLKLSTPKQEVKNVIYLEDFVFSALCDFAGLIDKAAED